VFLQLTRPLCNRHLICARHDAVSEIFESMGPQHSVNNLQDGGDRSCTASVLSDLCTVLSSVLALLGRSPDIQRGITRIFHCKATAKEVKCVFFLFVVVDCKVQTDFFAILCILATYHSGHLVFIPIADCCILLLVPHCLMFALQFVGVIQSILTSGKQLQKLVLEDIGIVSSPHKSVHSPLLRRLINTASSSTILNSAVKLLSCLNKDAADQGDMLNLFIASVDQFPEVNPSLKTNWTCFAYLF
jgi:hypothetical protein